MKKLIIIFFFSFSSVFIYAQKIVVNRFLIDIDDYDQVDTMMSKYKLYTLELYNCSGNQVDKDSCTFYWRKKYDKSGRLTEQEKGHDLNSNKVDFVVQYKKISDTTYETITKYPIGSQAVPDNIFVDTVIKGRKERVCLYRKDKDQNIVVRSMFNIALNNEIGSINRFDLDNKLIEIYYPLGNRKPIKDRTDTLFGEYRDTVIYNATFQENCYSSLNVYDKKKRVLESADLSVNSSDDSKGYSKTFFIYDAENHLIMKTNIDSDGQLISEERYYFKNGLLIKYTRDNDISDGFLNEEKSYDDLGNLIFFQSRSSAATDTNTWKYYINEKGLAAKREFYMNDKLRSVLIYNYK